LNVLLTPLSIVEIFELVNLQLVILIVVGLRGNIVRNDKSACCTCKVF